MSIPSSLPARLLSRLESQSSALLQEIFDLVRLESPSHDNSALNLVADHLTASLIAAGATVERIPNPSGGDHLRATWTEAHEPDLPPTLVLCHFDTVWPVGTLAGMPTQVVDGRATGPGIYDMKASLILIQAAIRAMAAEHLPPARPVVLLATSDEETGSPTSRGLIEAEALRAARALVLEAPLADGRLKTARKGVGCYLLRASGVSAHSGVEPEKGASAILELAHQILAIQSLARPDLGTTLNVGLISGGSAINVVPAGASASFDVRVATLAEAQRIDSALRELRPVGRQTSIHISGELNRPPMERTPGNAALFETARDLGRQIGLNLGDGSTGGGSDGNFTSALGCPTLDGLGCEGAGAHASHEHILVNSIAPRAALLALLLASDVGTTATSLPHPL